MWRSAVQLCAGLQQESDFRRTLLKDYLEFALDHRGLAAHGGLAQLARAPALQAGGQRFESVILHGSRRKINRTSYICKSYLKVIFDILTNVKAIIN